MDNVDFNIKLDDGEKEKEKSEKYPKKSDESSCLIKGECCD